MITCPKCKESLGDNIIICPFCRHEITDYERKLIDKAKQEEEDQALYEERIQAEAFCKVRVICFVAGIVYLLILMLISAILVNFGNEETGGIFVGIGALVYMIMYLYLILAKKINNCPHCGAYLHRNYGTNCQWCGRRIR